MPDPRTAREIAEHMIRVAAQNVEAMPIREATPRERKLLDMEDYDFLIDDVVGEIDKAIVTVTWPEPYPHCHDTPPVGHACPACGVSEADHG